jgi:Cation-independent mannose-6-phosphate receptor repeat
VHSFGSVVASTCCDDDLCHHAAIIMRLLFSSSVADKGEPVYSTEEHCSYVFTWSTSLVCVATLPECYTIVDGKLFDLSSLTRSDDEGLCSLGL